MSPTMLQWPCQLLCVDLHEPSFMPEIYQRPRTDGAFCPRPMITQERVSGNPLLVLFNDRDVGFECLLPRGQAGHNIGARQVHNIGTRQGHNIGTWQVGDEGTRLHPHPRYWPYLPGCFYPLSTICAIQIPAGVRTYHVLCCIGD